MKRVLLTCASVVSFVLCPLAARAQMPEAVGVRAQGMGGAFVAVADDATATWWNPAGLATGAYFNALLEFDQPNTPSNADVRAVAIALPSLGLSYYRLPISDMRAGAPVGSDPNSRQDQGYLNQFGITVGQSIGNHLVVSSTVKLVHAGDTQADLDLGAMVRAGRLRFAIVMKNLRQPTFGEGADALSLKRQSRVGAAYISGPHGMLDEFAVAADGDLATVRTALGDARHIAAGAEAWMIHRTLGLRGGVSANTVTDQGSASGGASVLLQSGRYLRTYVEGQLTRGSDESRRGWSAGLRLTF